MCYKLRIIAAAITTVCLCFPCEAQTDSTSLQALNVFCEYAGYLFSEFGGKTVYYRFLDSEEKQPDPIAFISDNTVITKKVRGRKKHINVVEFESWLVYDDAPYLKPFYFLAIHSPRRVNGADYVLIDVLRLRKRGMKKKISMCGAPTSYCYGTRLKRWRIELEFENGVVKAMYGYSKNIGSINNEYNDSPSGEKIKVIYFK